MRRTVLASALLLALLLPHAAAGDTDGWFPFVLPWDDAAPGPTDVSALVPAPAGANGVLTCKDGRFLDDKGNRVRLFGVNLCLSANFPDKADADKAAARLRKFGVNVVRLHLLDYYASPRGIFDAKSKDTQRFDARQLDRLDYLVSRLKQSGIYVNVNLHVARAFTAADGVPEATKLPRTGNVAAYFHPRLIELQKKYARDLLTHDNPYTKTRFTDEPAVAAIELTNENTLVGAAWGDTLDKLPLPYRTELARQWNAWLGARYGTTARLKAAWKVGDGAAGANLLRNADFAQGTAFWKLEAQKNTAAEMRAAAEAPPQARGKSLRVQVNQPGKEAWQIQLLQPGIDLKDGEPYTLSFWARASAARPVRVAVTLDQADWRNVGLSVAAKVDTQWRQFSYPFTPSQSRPSHNRIALQFGNLAGTLELAGLTLKRGSDETWPASASVENGTVPTRKPAATPAGQDWLAFLLDVEARYQTTMRDFVKKELGAKAPVVCSQASYGGLGGAFRERVSDFADMHAYWQHPTFPKRQWDPADWRVGNTAMTRDPSGGTFSTLSRYRIADKPFSVSEYNHSAPNDYQAETLPLLAAFAAWQDWDALYLFDYHADGAWSGDKIRGFFSVDSNPAKMALFPAAAAMFLRGDVPAAKGETRLEIPEDAPAALMGRNGHDIGKVWDGAGAKWTEALTRRLSLSFVAGAKAPSVRRTGEADASPPVRWEGRGTDEALFTVDTPKSKAIVGYVGGRVVELLGLKVVGKGPRFAALTLTALDGQAAEQSKSLLLTAVARVENPGMKWNADRTSVGKDWGSGPTRAEGVSASVTVQTQAKSATVWALDGAGKRGAQLDSTLVDGRLTFVIGPASKTLWYEIETSR